MESATDGYRKQSKGPRRVTRANHQSPKCFSQERESAAGDGSITKGLPSSCASGNAIDPAAKYGAHRLLRCSNIGASEHEPGLVIRVRLVPRKADPRRLRTVQFVCNDDATVPAYGSVEQINGCHVGDANGASVGTSHARCQRRAFVVVQSPLGLARLRAECAKKLVHSPEQGWSL